MEDEKHNKLKINQLDVTCAAREMKDVNSLSTEMITEFCRFQIVFCEKMIQEYLDMAADFPEDYAAQKVVEDSAAGFMFDFVACALWLLPRIEYDWLLLAKTMTAMYIMTVPSWKDGRFSDEENQELKRRLAAKIDDLNEMKLPKKVK